MIPSYPNQCWHIVNEALWEQMSKFIIRNMSFNNLYSKMMFTTWWPQFVNDLGKSGNRLMHYVKLASGGRIMTIGVGGLLSVNGFLTEPLYSLLLGWMHAIRMFFIIHLCCIEPVKYAYEICCCFVSFVLCVTPYQICIIWMENNKVIII